jgi:DNA polymerase-3 subunit gamma/tau
MSYLVLARKWRPQSFEEVVGQGHVTRTLQNAIASGRVGHGYLFTGPRGVGKTSTARILAKALNCAKGPTPHPCGECDSCKEVAGQGSVDVMEIDGASNNSVEDIRELREKVLYSGVRDRHKIYIIDEVHMLSSAAFNALLKTLEEPPSHVIFIFATTEAHKVPATILSRTQRFDFRRIGAKDLTGQLKKILDAEAIASSPEALSLVAKAAGGSMRDAQTLLDQVISYGASSGQAKAVTAEDVLQVLGGVQEGQALGALMAGLKGEAGPAFGWVQQLYERGADFRLALEALEELLRGLLLIKGSDEAAASSDLLPETLDALKALAPSLGLSRLLSLLKAAGEAESQLRSTGNPRLVLELFLIRLSATHPQGSLGELFDELGAMEKRLAVAPQAQAAPAPVSEPKVESPKPVKVEAGTPMPAVEDIAEAPLPATLDFEGLKQSWDMIVDKASAQSLMLGTCVRDAELASLDGKMIVLRTRNQKQKETLESPENRRKLQAAFLEALGQALDFKVLFAAPAPVAAKPKAEAASKPSAEEVEKLLKEAPGIKRIQELFDAEITEVKKI